MLEVRVVQLFPEIFETALRTSILGRASDASLVRYRIVALRDYAHDRHRTVDDYAFGGGAGMVLKPEPFFEALDDIGRGGPVVLLSARGRRFAARLHPRAGRGGRIPVGCIAGRNQLRRRGSIDDVNGTLVDDLAVERRAAVADGATRSVRG